MNRVPRCCTLFGLLLVASACAAQPAPDGRDDGHDVVRVGTLSVARAAHQATRLPSGDVLVAAGDARVERFNARTQAFETLAGEMEGANEFATATLLDSGEVLVLGGYDDQMQTTASAWQVRPARDDSATTAE